MNALKYAFLLCLGLMALGLRTPAAAQASGQSKQVVPRHPQPLPDLDSLQQARPELFPTESEEIREIKADTLFWEPQPEKGIGPPEIVERLLAEEKYAQAAQAFEYFGDTMQGEYERCYLLYAYMLFYNYLLDVDTTQTDEYKTKRDARLAEMEKQCPDYIEFLMMKVYLAEEPQEVVKWTTKAIAVKPKAAFYLSRANALWEMGQTKEACADYKQAAEKQLPDGVTLFTERCANR